MKDSIRPILLTILVVFLVFGLVHTTLQSYEVYGQSMESNFHDGDRVLVEKVSYRFRSPDRGDVIVFNPPNGSTKPYIKRIIGLPGETVELRNGEIYIDSGTGPKLLVETTDFGTQIPEYETYTYSKITLGEDEYFALGDNRDRSSDSRDWGPLAREDIIGRVWILYWPTGDLGFSPSYSWTLVEEE